MVPLIELRGAIPIGVKYGLSYPTAFGLAVLGSSLVFFPLFYFCKLILKHRAFIRLKKVLEQRVKKLNPDNMTTWQKVLAVFTFVAIPIPMTGVWTGTFVATFLGLRVWWAATAVIAGNLVAAGLILGLTAILGAYLDLFLYILFGVAIILLGYFIFKLAKAKNA